MLTSIAPASPGPRRLDLSKLTGWGLFWAALFAVTAGLHDPRSRIDPGFAFLPYMTFPAIATIVAWILPGMGRPALAGLAGSMIVAELVLSWSPLPIQPFSYLVLVAVPILLLTAIGLQVLAPRAGTFVRGGMAIGLLPVVGLLALLPTPAGLFWLIDWVLGFFGPDFGRSLGELLFATARLAPAALLLAPPRAWLAGSRP